MKTKTTLALDQRLHSGARRWQRHAEGKHRLNTDVLPHLAAALRADVRSCLTRGNDRSLRLSRRAVLSQLHALKLGQDSRSGLQVTTCSGQDSRSEGTLQLKQAPVKPSSCSQTGQNQKQGSVWIFIRSGCGFDASPEQHVPSNQASLTAAPRSVSYKVSSQHVQERVNVSQLLQASVNKVTESYCL